MWFVRPCGLCIWLTLQIQAAFVAIVAERKLDPAPAHLALGQHEGVLVSLVPDMWPCRHRSGFQGRQN